MATPGDLVKVTAAVLGLPEVYVHSIYRALREAGLVTKGGRGPSAARMSPKDAAALLVAILGTGQISASAETVKKFYETTPRIHTPQEERLYRGTKLPELASLEEKHSFVDALECLIFTASEGELFKGLRGDYPWNALEVVVWSPGSRADVKITGPFRGTSASLTYSKDMTGEMRELIRSDAAAMKENPEETIRRIKEEARKQRVDLEEFRRVKTNTFLYLGATLAGKLDHLPPLETFCK
jgi:hypothetical protein